MTRPDAHAASRLVPSAMATLESVTTPTVKKSERAATTAGGHSSHERASNAGAAGAAATMSGMTDCMRARYISSAGSTAALTSSRADAT